MSFVFPEPETNERAAALGLDIMPASFGEGFGAAFDDAMVRNPTATLGRMLRRQQFSPSTDEFGNEMPARTPSRMLTAREANDQYGIEGHLKFDADIPEPIAQELKGLKQRELERQDAMRRAQSGIGTSLSAGLVASLLDPLNVASAFVPVVGQARYAALAARYGTTGARAIVGGVEGAVGAALLEPIVLMGARAEQAEYDAMDSLASIAFGTILGSGLHMVGGAALDRIAARRQASVIERQIDDLPRADQEALARTAVAQMVEGRPVDVGPVVDAVRPRQVEAATPEFRAKVETLLAEAGDRFAESPPVSTYTTGKGSVYFVHEDGTTTRHKAARADAGHEGDSGWKSQTEKTIYVDTDIAPALSAAGVQNIGDKGARLVIRDGVASLLTWNERAGRWGVSPESKNIPFTTVPEVGKSPLELWRRVDDVPGYEAYANQHAGNKITETGTVSSPRSADPSNIAARAEENVRYADPEDAVAADTATRRVSEEAGQARPLADEVKAMEEEVKALESLVPADRDPPGASVEEKKARLYAKAFEAAAACSIRKA